MLIVKINLTVIIKLIVVGSIYVWEFLEIKLKIYEHFEDVYLLLFHGKTTERILMKLQYSYTIYTLEKHIGYNSYINTDGAARKY